MAFKRATRSQLKARISIDGPAKAGKTFTALRFAFALAANRRVFAIDTEFRSMAKYQGMSSDGIPFDFSVEEDMVNFSPDNYTSAIEAAGKAGAEVLIIDSLSHAWIGTGGSLDQKDQAVSKGKNSFTAWADVSPQHRRMIDAILSFPGHIISTMRAKMVYIMEKDERNSTTVRKVGLAPVQREGVEYEFDLVCSIDANHVLHVTGSRCSAMDGRRMMRPGAAFLAPYVEWLGQGQVAAEGQALPPTEYESLYNRAIAASEPAEFSELTKLAESAKLRMRPHEFDRLKAFIAERHKEAVRRLRTSESTAGVATTPTAPAPSSNGSADSGASNGGMVSNDQLQEIASLRIEFYTTTNLKDPEQQKAAWADLLKRYNVASARMLTSTQAAELIAHLEQFCPFTAGSGNAATAAQPSNMNQAQQDSRQTMPAAS